MSTRIISFFSDLRPGLTERLYRYPGQQGRPPLSGAHTNEAPLYYLLTTFAPVDEILYLRTRQVREDQVDCGREGFLTAEEYLQKRVARFCQDRGLPQPQMTPLDYDPANPDMEQALRALLTGIQPRDRIYLDVTGGPRNVSFLMLLLTRALSYKNCSVEQVVYSSIVNGQNAVVELANVPQLFDIINGLHEFTSFGSADTLVRVLAQDPAPQVQDLIRDLQAFTEAIRLCRADLDLLEQMLADLNRDLDRCGALQDSHPLLSALLPVFRQELGFGDRKLTITGLVRWCAQNRMIQQAMTIYNEHLAHAMIQGETPYLLVSPDARELLSREPFYAKSQREVTDSDCFQSFSYHLVAELERWAASTGNVPFPKLAGAERRQILQQALSQPGVRAALMVEAAADPLEGAAIPPALPSLPVESQALVHLLRALFQSPGQRRTREGSLSYLAQQDQLELALPVLQKDWKKDSQMADVLERLADPGHNGDRLRRILLTPLSAAPYRQVVLDLLDRRKLRLRPGASVAVFARLALDSQYVNLMRNQINHALGDSSNRGKMHALNRLGYHANLGRLTTQELSSFFLESVGRLEHLGREVKAASGAPLPQPPESPSPQVTEDLLRQLQEKANAKML